MTHDPMPVPGSSVGDGGVTPPALTSTATAATATATMAAAPTAQIGRLLAVGLLVGSMVTS